MMDSNINNLMKKIMDQIEMYEKLKADLDIEINVLAESASTHGESLRKIRRDYVRSNELIGELEEMR
ncbi:MAG: hypothetical protein M1460_04260 [Candidatus Thermoplasmatota archaeon]|jgi:hypothetical protein|nr:hypothetical protein [Candidatus Thermoplasmatota archaeon]